MLEKVSGSIISEKAAIASTAIIKENVIIEDDVIIRDYAVIYPNTHLKKEVNG